jgi:tetratricopeptide (TPR) repeat protein
MNTFEITIQRKTGQHWPLVIRHQPGTGALALWSRGTLELDTKKLETLLPTGREFGQALGKAVFRDDIRDSFVRAVAEAKAADEPLRVLLFIEAEDLRHLHWEQLHAPLDRGWDYLLLNQSTPFSLYLPSQIERRYPPIGRRDLRALVLVAGPEELAGDYGLEPFDVAATVASIRAALGEIPADVLASVPDAVGPPTLEALVEQLIAGRHTLLHIVAHGAYKAEKDETDIYFPRDAKRGPIRSGELIERPSRLDRLPQFTFLSTCESADPRAETGLGSLAQRLVRDLGMPAVLAMTDKVSIPTAEALASTFYARLREHGEIDRALGEALGTLQGRFDLTVPALFSRLGGRPLFSDSLDRPLTAEEVRFGLDRLPALVKQRAPVLLADSETLADRLRSPLGADLSALSADSRREFDLTLNALNQLCAETLDISFNALALGQDPPAYDDRCPFQGLMAFKPENKEFFFGREALVEKLQNKIREHNFLAVLGPSGSGKSSLVFAGLVPALGLPWVSLNPGNDPAAAFASVTEEHRLIIIDQFEELFTLASDDSARQAFISKMLDLAQTRKVILTLRADFWGEIARYAALKDEMQAHQELVPPMTPDELRQAIERQAEKVGLRFEADLSEDILDDVQDEPGAMPLLQHALLLLWERRHGRWLRQDEYRAIGGIQKAIAKTADDLYESLSQAEQRRVRDIFMHLTRLDEDSDGETRDTRRRMALEELVPAGQSPEATVTLVNRLADARLVVTGQTVEVAHEAIIRHWPRLRAWLDENRQELLLHARLADAACQWRILDRDPGALLRGIRLERAQTLAQTRPEWITQSEREYLDLSLENAHREAAQAQRLRLARRTQLLLGGAAVLLVLGLFAVLWFNGFFAPARMNGIFNVAVADFGETAPDGQVNTSDAGEQVGGWAVNYLRETLQDDPNVEIWPRKGGPLDRTRIGLVASADAGDKASEIGANLIYFGVIQPSGSQAELSLGFYIAPQFEYRFEDIQGRYAPGRPIRIADLGNPGPSVQAELEKQSTLIARLALGLTQVQLGNSEQALRAFEQAAQADPASAVAQFFIGRESLFLANQAPGQGESYRQAAEAAFQKSINLDSTYARAYIGLGSVYTDRAADLLDDALSSGQPLDLSAFTHIEQAIQSYRSALDLEPDPAKYGNPVADVARMALGHAYQLQGTAAALSGDAPAALAAFEQAAALLDEARLAFESSVGENESHRRYLAQVYEYLGETRQWQGYAHELAFEYPEAKQSYEMALAAYELCIAQAENTPDLIIRDQIVGLYCQPYALDTQSQLEIFNGEQ